MAIVNFHWYGLIVGLAVVLVMELSEKVYKQRNKNSWNEAVVWFGLFGGIIGARLYHVIDWWARYYSLEPIRIFYLWEGGLSIWGAILGSGLGIYLFSKLKNLDILDILDAIVVATPLGQSIGRWGNYVNGELIGKEGLPLFLIESVLNLLLFLVLWRKRNNMQRGLLTGLYLIGYGMIRLCLEGLRQEVDIWKLWNMPVASMFSLLAIVIGLAVIWKGKQS